MAPRSSRSKGSRGKGERKKRDEKAALPVVLDVVVNTPDPGRKQLLVKAISTDRICDLRRLLAAHMDTCHMTSFSLSHEELGDALEESAELASLKPCVLSMVPEPYDVTSATVHVRRLLDIVSCTTAFGPASQEWIRERESKSMGGPQDGDSATSAVPGGTTGLSKGATSSKEDIVASLRGSTPRPMEGQGEQQAAVAMAEAAAAAERGDPSGMVPPQSALGQFYEFISAAHVPPPVLGIQRMSAAEAEGLSLHLAPLEGEGEQPSAVLFWVQVTVAGGKSVVLAATPGGFQAASPASRPAPARESTIVGALRSVSKAFAKAYDELLVFFSARNKFGNLPISFRSNTWVVPPPSAASPGAFPHLPVEDPEWGGNGGGCFATPEHAPSGISQGQGKELEQGTVVVAGDGMSSAANWCRAFSRLAQMPCSTPEDRLARDRRAFVLHSMYVDAAVRAAVEVINSSVAEGKRPISTGAVGKPASEVHPADVVEKLERGVRGEGRGGERLVSQGEWGPSPSTSSESDGSFGGMSPASDDEGEGLPTCKEGEGVLGAQVCAGGCLIERDVGGGMRVRVRRGFQNPSEKHVEKLDWSEWDQNGGGPGRTLASVCAANLAKGIGSHESTAVQDLRSLTTVLVHHSGYCARVELPHVSEVELVEGDATSCASQADDSREDAWQDGGANSLNLNSLRVLLHAHSQPSPDSTPRKDAKHKGDTAATHLELRAERLILQVLATGLRSISGVDQLQLQDQRGSPKGVPLATSSSSTPAPDGAVSAAGSEGGDRTGVGSKAPEESYLRWELGACWVQHLKTQKEEREATAREEDRRTKADRGTESVPSHVDGVKVKGEGALAGVGPDEPQAVGEGDSVEMTLSAEDLGKLRDLGLVTPTDKSMQALVTRARQFYSETALPRLVADLASLELSPVDGRTLADFMHSRGLRVHSLGDLAREAHKLPHVRTLAVQEMVARAQKCLLHSAIATCPDSDGPLKAQVVAMCFNAFFGQAQGLTQAQDEEGAVDCAQETEEGNCGVREMSTGDKGPSLKPCKTRRVGSSKEDAKESAANYLTSKKHIEPGNDSKKSSPFDWATWQRKVDARLAASPASGPVGSAAPALSTIRALVELWQSAYVMRRFAWALSGEDLSSLRAPALLRSLCLKVGIEIAPKNYLLGRPVAGDEGELHGKPFAAQDIVSLVPTVKHVLCTSADARSLLEASKTALDKGKLEEAVSCGAKALTKMVAVCGPFHRMTAGAYSLLAVVLYHTGDFNQATLYQQKALDINERELGLDHPDTIKSYGDLAVFYYRLHHTELALRYVTRALYLLHWVCGAWHPNTAATYINAAMMEEGLGNAHVALRYLHAALTCNQRLLGVDHIQTAASYHAIAIALSLMDAYSLSVQHEQTTLRILQQKLGDEDLRTKDAAAWLEYFESKALEQQEAQRTGAPKPDASIASKGHLSVSDLLEFIHSEQERGRREIIEEVSRKRGRKALVFRAHPPRDSPQEAAVERAEGQERDQTEAEAEAEAEAEEEQGEQDTPANSSFKPDTGIGSADDIQQESEGSDRKEIWPQHGVSGAAELKGDVEGELVGPEEAGEWQEAAPRLRGSRLHAQGVHAQRRGWSNRGQHHWRQSHRKAQAPAQHSSGRQCGPPSTHPNSRGAHGARVAGAAVAGPTAPEGGPGARLSSGSLPRGTSRSLGTPDSGHQDGSLVPQASPPTHLPLAADPSRAEEVHPWQGQVEAHSHKAVKHQSAASGLGPHQRHEVGRPNSREAAPPQPQDAVGRKEGGAVGSPSALSEGRPSPLEPGGTPALASEVSETNSVDLPQAVVTGMGTGSTRVPETISAAKQSAVTTTDEITLPRSWKDIAVGKSGVEDVVLAGVLPAQQAQAGQSAPLEHTVQQLQSDCSSSGALEAAPGDPSLPLHSASADKRMSSSAADTRHKQSTLVKAAESLGGRKAQQEHASLGSEGGAGAGIGLTGGVQRTGVESGAAGALVYVGHCSQDGQLSRSNEEQEIADQSRPPAGPVKGDGGAEEGGAFSPVQEDGSVDGTGGVQEKPISPTAGTSKLSALAAAFEPAPAAPVGMFPMPQVPLHPPYPWSHAGVPMQSHTLPGSPSGVETQLPAGAMTMPMQVRLPLIPGMLPGRFFGPVFLPQPGMPVPLPPGMVPMMPGVFLRPIHAAPPSQSALEDPAAAAADSPTPPACGATQSAAVQLVHGPMLPPPLGIGHMPSLVHPNHVPQGLIATLGPGYEYEGAHLHPGTHADVGCPLCELEGPAAPEPEGPAHQPPTLDSENFPPLVPRSPSASLEGADGESAADLNTQFMNPGASEFVPGQSWDNAQGTTHADCMPVPCGAAADWKAVVAGATSSAPEVEACMGVPEAREGDGSVSPMAPVADRHQQAQREVEDHVKGCSFFTTTYVKPPRQLRLERLGYYGANRLASGRGPRRHISTRQGVGFRPTKALSQHPTVALSKTSSEGAEEKSQSGVVMPLCSAYQTAPSSPEGRGDGGPGKGQESLGWPNAEVQASGGCEAADGAAAISNDGVEETGVTSLQQVEVV